MNPSAFLRHALASAACLLALSQPAAHAAGMFRTYLASDGSDSNPCTLLAPCRLLPAGLAAVADGGEIWMLDSANYNTGQVNVTKSVSILAVPGAVGSVVATGGGHAIHIDTPSVQVTLRNLVIVNLSNGVNGVNFIAGARLDMTDCVIANMPNAGLYVTASSGRVTVTDSVLRDNGNYGIVVNGSAVGVFDGVRVRNSTYGFFIDTGPRVTVSNSVVSGSLASAVYAIASGGTTRVVVERSLLTENFYGITALAMAAGDVVQVTSSQNFITQNPSAGISASQGAGAQVNIVVDGNTVTENGTGFLFAAGTPTIRSRGNNTLSFNNPDIAGGTLSPMGGL